MIVVGSTALKLNGIYGLEPKDLDIICCSSEFKDIITILQREIGKVVKLDFTDKGASAFFKIEGMNKIYILEASFTDKDTLAAQLQMFLSNNIQYLKTEDIHGLMCVSVKPEVVLMMKLSHRYKKDSQHFHKTMDDIIMLRSKGIKLDDTLTAHLKEREALTYQLWNQKPYKLDVKSNEFFTDNVKYIVDHDSLHEAVKHLWKPAYQYYMQDNAEVMCSKEKFDKLPELVKLLGVLEETYVLALERAVIPHNAQPTWACSQALEKVCTGITSGWFREYAYDNYYKIWKLVDTDGLMQKYKLGLDNGVIRPFMRKT